MLPLNVHLNITVRHLESRGLFHHHLTDKVKIVWGLEDMFGKHN